MIDQQWLTIIIVLLIVVILIDGVRRMRKAKKDSIKMSLRAHNDDTDEDDIIYGSEFPNGGARTSDAEIDKDRILKARSRYNFGDDLPKWNAATNSLDRGESPDSSEESLDLTAAESEQTHEPAVTSDIEPTQKIEPSVSFDDHDDLDEVPDAAFEPEEGTASAEVLENPQKRTSPVSSESVDQPIQTSLNLEDDVPMLMEEVEDEADSDTALDADKLSEESVSTPSTQTLEEPIQNVAANIEPSVAEIGLRSANKPRFESKYTAHADQRGQTPQDVLVINLRTRGEDFIGSDVLPVLLDNDMRFGAMDIFHHHAQEDGEGDVLFSMANIVKPGTFDLASFDTFQTVGFSFFLTLPVTVGTHMQAFDKMVTVTQAMAESLDAELLDENRSVLTRQVIEHYRERVRDFSRKEQLEKNK